MIKITIACLAQERQQTIEALQKLGTVHVTPWQTAASQPLEQAKHRAEQLKTVLHNLEQIQLPAETHLVSTGQPASAILEQTAALLQQQRELDENVKQTKKALELLAPWNFFSKEQLNELAARGLYLYPCVQPHTLYKPNVFGEAQKVISQDGNNVYFAVLSRTALDENSLPLAQLPAETDKAYWEQRQSDLSRTENELKQKLTDIARKYLPALREYEKALYSEIEFILARDTMGGDKRLSFLKGYLPADKLPPLRQTAQENSWALRYEEIAEDDELVPTNLKIPKFFQMAKCIFDFVGILPGYHEQDVSICVMIFLSVFCGMLVGDAGYGLLFTLLSLFGCFKAQKNESKKGCQLLLIMSICILIYGSLTGTWFGIEQAKLPRFMRGLTWFTSQEKGSAHIQLVCFFLGAIQMSLACAWQAILALKDLRGPTSRKAFILTLRRAIGQIGWGGFLWANFGLANLLIIHGKPLEQLPRVYAYLFAISFVVILICAIDWTNMGDVIYMPFTFINCFVDVLSYIRLFAVGLSSMYIAQCFNAMGASIYKFGPWYIPFAIALLAVGHLLNIALAAMGVLVHGIRLNTLEFSGHMGISWSGKPYRPLK